MRALFILAALISFTGAGAAACEQEARAALGFMNAYIQYTQDVTSKRTSLTTGQWLAQSKLLSPGFLAHFRELEAEGLKRDPDLGWGVDLIVDAQDSPDNEPPRESWRPVGLSQAATSVA